MSSADLHAIAVLGAGGVGGLVAGALAHRQEAVAVVAREETAEKIERDGIHVHSVVLGEFNARPAAVSALEDPVDALIVTTKAVGLREALERIDAEPVLVVPLLNGVDHMRVLRERFGPERVAAGVIRVESHRTEPGVISQTSPFLRIDMADDSGALRPGLEALAARLESAGIPTAIGESEAGVLWGKLARLNALALTTSAFDLTLGQILATPELLDELKAAIAETAAVARAEGAEVDPAAVFAELTAAHPELNSSMNRDIAAGREPELDAIAGAVLRAGARHGLACPTVQRLAEQVAQRAGIDAPTAQPT